MRRLSFRGILTMKKQKQYAVWVEPSELPSEPTISGVRFQIGISEVDGVGKTEALSAANTIYVPGQKRKIGTRCIAAFAPDKAVRKYVRSCLPAVIYVEDDGAHEFADWATMPAKKQKNNKKVVPHIMDRDSLGHYVYKIY